jgi:hypothetical protein
MVISRPSGGASEARGLRIRGVRYAAPSTGRRERRSWAGKEGDNPGLFIQTDKTPSLLSRAAGRLVTDPCHGPRQNTLTETLRVGRVVLLSRRD